MLSNTLRELQLYFVHEAPSPIFSGLDGSHNRMLGPMKVLGRMLVLGRITTSNVAANHAQSKMHPSIAHFQALFAALRVRLYILDLI
jgi:hypothetical protein